VGIVTKFWNWSSATPKRKNATRALIGLALVLLVPALWLAWWLGSPLFIDDVANEDFPLTVNATLPDDVSRSEAESMMETAAKLESPMNESMSAEMGEASTISLKMGSFRDEDRLHRGSGNATVYKLEDASHILRLEDLNVTNGPDLHVLLMVDPGGRDKTQGYLDLGKLKGNVGNQNYEIPSDSDIADYNAVMIYCQPFHVIFSTAPLQ
jgi:hypothetical protein